MATMREYVSKAGETTWQVLYRQGKRQRSITFDNPKSAQRLVELIAVLGVDRGLAAHAQETPSAALGPTLDEIAAQWFAWREKRGDLTARALADYRRDFDNWISPFLGHREAALITELDVQNWVDGDLPTKLGPKSIADRHALLHGIYAWAAQRKRSLVPHNPCLETELPKRHKTPPKGLTIAEWAALKEAFYSIEGAEDAADLALFMASTGWRIGEATGLLVGSVDDTGDHMYVSVSHVRRKGEGIVAGAKSEAGLRRIRMLPECAAMLRRRVVGKGPTRPVFTNSHSPTGEWEQSTFRRRWWAKAVAKAGLSERKPTPHWLRHTHVLLCHAAGMSLPEIQRRIGHEDIKTTINVYGRLIDGMSDDVADRLDLLVSGAPPAVVAGEVVAGELA